MTVAGGGNTKLDHIKEMLLGLIAHKDLQCNRVLMDSWYAMNELMLLMDALGKLCDCPLKNARLVDDSGAMKYRHSLPSSNRKCAKAKTIKMEAFPKEKKVKLFRVEVSNHRMDWAATTDLAQDCTDGTQKACAIRQKLEQLHPKLKQVTCPKARRQRTHIARAVLVWMPMTQLVRQALTNICSLKKGMLFHCIQQELRSLSVRLAVQRQKFSQSEIPVSFS